MNTNRVVGIEQLLDVECAVERSSAMAVISTVGTYKVYHREMDPIKAITTSHVHVADVQGTSLDDVFDLTNWGGSDYPEDKVTQLVLNPRSTSVGDIVVSPDGVSHIVVMSGWIHLV
jgi:hypothetical protein